MQKNLNEIKTIRTSPVARFVRKVALSSYGNVPSVVNKLYSYARTNELGSGMRASVIEAPKKDSVIKMYNKDTAYDSFLDYSRSNKDNPHVPMIKQRGKMSLSKDGNRNLHFVHMEKLEPLAPNHPLRDVMPTAIVGYPNKIRAKLDSGEYDGIKAKYPKIHKVISDMVDKHINDENPPTIDLHHGNIMQRKDGTPVITDPMVNWKDDDFGGSRIDASDKDPASVGKLGDMIRPKVKLTSADHRLLDQLKEEGAPTNNVGSGAVAGLGVGPKGEPGRNTSLMPMVRRSKNFAGKAVFSVPPRMYDEARLEKRKYQRWTKYLDEDASDELAPIREYANAHPASPIIIENEKTGAMCYVKYGKK